MSGETTITIIGNLVADPELRATKTGANMASFTIASTPRTFDKQRNEWTDGAPLFMRCIAWRDLAQHVTESLSKGARVIAVGRLTQRAYEDQNKTKHTVTELQVDEIAASLRYATLSIQKTSSANSVREPVEVFQPAQPSQPVHHFQPNMTSDPWDDPTSQF